MAKVTPYDINPVHLAELITTVRLRRKLEIDNRQKVEAAHDNLKLTIDLRSTAEKALFDYVSQLADRDPRGVGVDLATRAELT